MINNRRIRKRDPGEIKWIHDYKAAHPSVPQKTIKAEFEKRFGKALPQATLSDILRKPCPKDSFVPGSSESTAHDAGRGNLSDGEHVLPNYTDIHHATAVDPDSSAALDETSSFGTQRQHTMSYADGLQDLQYEELQHQPDPTQSASTQYPHSNTPAPPHELGPDQQGSIDREQDGSSYQADIMDPPLPSAESHGSLMASYGDLSALSVEDPSLGLLEYDWWQMFCDQAAISETQTVDLERIFNEAYTSAQDVASTPAQGDASIESSAGQLPETGPLHNSQSPNQSPLKGLSGNSIKRVLSGNSSQQGPSFKRHRVQEGNTRESGDISQSVDTLTSLFWADEGILHPFAEKEAKRALKNIVKDINKRYLATGKKDVNLIREIRDHLMKSLGFMIPKRSKESAPVPLDQHSNRTSESSQKTAQLLQYRQGNIVYSYQSPCARVDVVMKRRCAGICPNSYPPADASGTSVSGAKGKNRLEEDEEVYSEMENLSTTYGGTLVLTPTNGQPQFALSIGLPPKISFRTTIPSTSTIFKLAAFGTLDQLQECLKSRTESWNVCDENGASLINYAVTLLNIPNCRYLLDLVEEVDIFEPPLLVRESQDRSIERLSDCGVSPIFSFPVGSVNEYVEEDNIENFVEKSEMWCKMLLERGADPSLLDGVPGDSHDGYTIFLAAINCQSAKTLEDILNHGTPFISVNSDSGPDRRSPLLELTRCFASGGSDMYEAVLKVDLLLKRGADFTARDAHGRTCLGLMVLSRAPQHRCCSYPRWCVKHYERDAEQILIALIKAGADVCASDHFGLTVSEAARSCGSLSLWVKVLKICGYDYWKDQPPGVLVARRTGNVNERVTEVEDSDFESGDGMDFDEDAESGEGMESDDGMNSDEDMHSERGRGQ